MSKSVDETRREFLLKLARTAALVPPAIATLDVAPGLAQGKGSGSSQSGGKGQGVAAGQASGGTMSPMASQGAPADDAAQLRGTEVPAPWSSDRATPPPWSRPPPTQTGR